MENRKEHMTFFKRKKVLMFGFIGYHRLISGYDLQVDKEDFVLEELRYRTYDLKKDDALYLQQGGSVRGAYRDVRFKEIALPRYFYFNKITGAFKNCWIDEYTQGFGEYLLQILNEEF